MVNEYVIRLLKFVDIVEYICILEGILEYMVFWFWGILE